MAGCSLPAAFSGARRAHGSANQELNDSKNSFFYLGPGLTGRAPTGEVSNGLDEGRAESPDWPAIAAPPPGMARSVREDLYLKPSRHSGSGSSSIEGANVSHFSGSKGLRGSDLGRRWL